jgi:hypothetical protein
VLYDPFSVCVVWSVQRLCFMIRSAFVLYDPFSILCCMIRSTFVLYDPFNVCVVWSVQRLCCLWLTTCTVNRWLYDPFSVCIVCDLSHVHYYKWYCCFVTFSTHWLLSLLLEQSAWLTCKSNTWKTHTTMLLYSLNFLPLSQVIFIDDQWRMFVIGYFIVIFQELVYKICTRERSNGLSQLSLT